MSVPNAREAVVDPAKIRDYLLSRTHAVGRSKSLFFMRLGYRQADWIRLARDLHGLLIASVDHAALSSPYGTKYVVTGNLKGPAGRSAVVTTVWIVTEGEIAPRFVTAYPGAQG